MNRKFAIGCVVGLIIVAGLIGWGISAIPKLISKGSGWVQSEIAEQQRIKAFEAGWTPVSPVPDATWFPAQVGAATLLHSAPFSALPELNITKDGYRGTYLIGGAETEVIAVPANDLEQEALIGRVKGALLASGASNLSTSSGTRMHIKVAGKDHTRIWWVKGRLFIFRERKDHDPDAFSLEYLKAIAQPTAAGLRATPGPTP